MRCCGSIRDSELKTAGILHRRNAAPYIDVCIQATSTTHSAAFGVVSLDSFFFFVETRVREKASKSQSNAICTDSLPNCGSRDASTGWVGYGLASDELLFALPQLSFILAAYTLHGAQRGQ